jgi:hypothetical protein
MGNTIALAKSYVPNLDEIYKLSSLSAVLTSDQGLARAGAKANEIIIPKISMDGLGDYSRSNGYAQGDVTLEWETVPFNYDRGRKFVVDVEDDEETINTAFGRLGAEFMRTKVVPEVDAFTFAQLSAKAGTTVSATLSSGTDVTAAITAANSAMDDAEVPADGRILFITATHRNAIEALDTIKSREMLARFSQIITVPQSRFYTAIDMLDGTTSGEEAGGYTKHVSTGAGDTAGADINFMIVHPSAVVKFSKRVVGNVIPPELNSDSDGYIMKFREYDLVDVFDNKVKGVYVHSK